jgi:thiol reductant ABC exporter CydD subunit
MARREHQLGDDPGSRDGSSGPTSVTDDGAALADASPPRARRRAGPVDPRLLRFTRGTRRYFVVTVLLGCLTAVLVLAQAWLLATCIASAVLHHEDVSHLEPRLATLLVVIVLRSSLGWFGEVLAARTSVAAKSDLRDAFVEKVGRLGPTGIDRERSGRLIVVATSGIDALDGYFARYLPQLVLAVVIPLTVVAVALGADWISAAIIAVTVPLIPLFISLVGATTRVRMGRQAQALQRLAGHFLDVVAGLATLKVFGRAKAQVDAIRDVTDRYRSATMSTLKVAFLSSLILELLATVSVALVAVAVGLRLLGGHLEFSTALFVLLLAPEAYLPLRTLGTTHHASAEGMQAAEELFEVLERPEPRRGTRRDIPDPSRCDVQIEDLEVRYEGRTWLALRLTSLVLAPGETVALAGPSGSGKSTLLSVLLAMAPSWTGSVRVGGVALEDLDPDAWRERIAWVPQRPHLFAMSIVENIRLARPGATADELKAAVEAAGLVGVGASLPDGLETPLGDDGAGLSVGERQRVALARAFLRDAPLVLLDEPTASLDGSTEEEVLAAVRRVTAGRTVLLAAHRPSLLTLADRVIHVSRAEVLAT